MTDEGSVPSGSFNAMGQDDNREVKEEAKYTIYFLKIVPSVLQTVLLVSFVSVRKEV